MLLITKSAVSQNSDWELATKCIHFIEQRSTSIISDTSAIIRSVWLPWKCKCKSLSRVRLVATPCTSSWNSPGQNTGVGSLSLLQGIFPIQGSDPDLPHCRWILHLTHVLNVKKCPYNEHSSFIYTGSERETQQRYKYLTSIEARISFKWTSNPEQLACLHTQKQLWWPCFLYTSKHVRII